MSDSIDRAREELFSRLHAQRGEIEQAIETRVYSIAELGEGVDPEYRGGLRAALNVALDYALVTVRRGEEHAPPLPPALLAQTRLAARCGVSLDVVIRRYLAGHGLLAEFILSAAAQDDLVGSCQLQRLLRGQSAVFDRLIAAISDEHGRETAALVSSPAGRRAHRIRCLLAGEAIDGAELNYDFDGIHVGLAAVGPERHRVLTSLAKELDQRLLVAPSGDELWAWLGSKNPPDLRRLQRIATQLVPPTGLLALGEPCRDLEGWRLTHRQAKAAMAVAQWAGHVVRYADVALVAAALQDPLLAPSLPAIFLDPLTRGPGGGQLLETLRAYLHSENNASSAAAAMGISRHTVTSRLRLIEELLGRRLSECMAELDTALRLEAITS